MKWISIALLLCSACRTAAVAPQQMAETRVRESIARSSSEADKQGPANFRVRFNPAKCECPPYEVFAYGRWIRAFVDVESPELDALRTGDPLAVATLVLQLESRRRAAENGVLYPVVAAP